MINSSWSYRKLGEVVQEIGDGGTPSRATSENFGGNIPWAVVDDIRWHIYDTKEKLSQQGISASSSKLWKPGTIILSTGATIGRVGIARVPLCTKQGIHGIACDPKTALSEYVAYYLQHCHRKLNALAQGSTIKEIRAKQILALDIPIPPLSEQEKIVKILTGIDSAIQAGKHLASKIKKQYQGILRETFSDDSSDLSPEKYLPLDELDLDISDGNYSSKYPSANEFVERGIPFIRASNMKEGTIDDSGMRFISAKKHQEITKGHLKSGDILIANRGEIGKSCRVPERHIGSNINAQVVRINGGKTFDQSFLYHYFSSPHCQSLIDELTTGTALKQLPISNLAKLLLPVPSIEVQIEIGSALDSMQRTIHAIKNKNHKYLCLKQAIAADLFSGRKRISV